MNTETIKRKSGSTFEAPKGWYNANAQLVSQKGLTLVERIEMEVAEADEVVEVPANKRKTSRVLNNLVTDNFNEQNEKRESSAEEQIGEIPSNL